MKIFATLLLVLLACVLARADHRKCGRNLTGNSTNDFYDFAKCHGVNLSTEDSETIQARLKHFLSCLESLKNHDETKTKHKKRLSHHCLEPDFNSSLNHHIGNDRPPGPTAPTFYAREPLPANWNWVNQGAVSAIKNQGRCGSCYTFAAAAALESAHYLRTGKLYNLSTQQLVDCSYGYGVSYTWSYKTKVWTPNVVQNSASGNQGCNGGFYSSAWMYTNISQPLVTWECYNYTSGVTRTNGKCSVPACSAKVGAFSFVSLPSNNETALQYAIRYIGPVACSIDANPIMMYAGGVISAKGNGVNHAITVVGYGYSAALGDHWIVRNSWGPFWGVGGYFYVQRGNNALNIASNCAYPTLV